MSNHGETRMNHAPQGDRQICVFISSTFSLRKTYRELLDTAFADYSGTVISGGTREGTSGLVGELGRKRSRRLHAIGRLLADWPLAPRSGLSVIPDDAMTLRAFLRRGDTGVLGVGQIEKGACAQHEEFLKENRYRSLDPVMKPWPELREEFKESNRDQIRYIPSILRASGYRLAPLSEGRGLTRFPNEVVERMAEMEHGRWNVERRQDGWQLGLRDPANKRSPFIVPWRELPNKVKGYDRDNVGRWPDILRHLGMAIHLMAAARARSRAARPRKGGTRRRKPPARSVKRR